MRLPIATISLLSPLVSFTTASAAPGRVSGITCLRSYTNRDCRVRCFGGHLSVLGASGLPRRPLDDHRNDWAVFGRSVMRRACAIPSHRRRVPASSPTPKIWPRFSRSSRAERPIERARRWHKTTGLVNDREPDCPQHDPNIAGADGGVASIGSGSQSSLVGFTERWRMTQGAAPPVGHVMPPTAEA